MFHGIIAGIRLNIHIIYDIIPNFTALESLINCIL